MRPNNSHRPQYQQLVGTPIDPFPRIRLEAGSQELTMRAMDMICPIGMGQRGLIVAPPGSGKTTFLKHICQAVARGTPEIKLYCLLIDERPEEVTEFKRTIPGEVHYSSTDQSYEHHIEIADQLMRRAFVEVAAGANVMIVIDSLTRLARVHNAQTRSSGRTISGGVDARALEVPRRIFGAARKIEHAGSLTILATILIETGSRMDEVIFEEFKGTGNMELQLDRNLFQRRIYPAIDIKRSNTRHEELLVPEGDLQRAWLLRKAFNDLNSAEAMELLIDKISKFKTNADFLQNMNK